MLLAALETAHDLACHASKMQQANPKQRIDFISKQKPQSSSGSQETSRRDQNCYFARQ
jgi:hypothetical protein